MTSAHDFSPSMLSSSRIQVGCCCLAEDLMTAKWLRKQAFSSSLSVPSILISATSELQIAGARTNCQFSGATARKFFSIAERRSVAVSRLIKTETITSHPRLLTV